jgi:hypothetical protein
MNREARRASGLTYQIPIEIGSIQGKTFIICWLLKKYPKNIWVEIWFSN